jgi:glutamyl-tRNA reductase
VRALVPGGQVGVVGLKRSEAAAALFERTVLDPEQRRLLLAEVRAAGFPEALVLSTCHRTEVYVATRSAEADTSQLGSVFCRATGLRHEELRHHGYALGGRSAVEHLFTVASGLDSPVLGETEIVGQIRASAALAGEQGSLGDTLEALVARSLTAGRRVRAATGLSRGSVSLPSAVVSQAAYLTGELDGASALVIGFGQLAQLLLRCLRERGARPIVASRSAGTRAARAALGEGQLIGLGQVESALREVDVVFCAAGAARPLLTRAMLSRALRRRSRSLVVIDLGIPPNVEVGAAGLKDLQLRHLDDVHRAARAELSSGMIFHPGRAREIAQEEVDRFEAWMRASEADELLAHVRRYAEGVRRSELERLMARTPDLGPGELERLDQFTRLLMRRLLHEPAALLREAASARLADPRLVALAQAAELFTPSGKGETQASPTLSLVPDEGNGASSSGPASRPAAA